MASPRTVVTSSIGSIGIGNVAELHGSAMVIVQSDSAVFVKNALPTCPVILKVCVPTQVKSGNVKSKVSATLPETNIVDKSAVPE